MFMMPDREPRLRQHNSRIDWRAYIIGTFFALTQGFSQYSSPPTTFNVWLTPILDLVVSGVLLGGMDTALYLSRNDILDSADFFTAYLSSRIGVAAFMIGLNNIPDSIGVEPKLLIQTLVLITPALLGSAAAIGRRKIKFPRQRKH